MKKLLVVVGSALALAALYVSTNLNSKKKDTDKENVVEEIDDDLD